MADYIHGETDAREVARLRRQARFVGGLMLEGFGARPGDVVLDLATGVGAMAEELLARFPEIRLIGLDLRAEQLRAAHERLPALRWVQGDAERLPFRDATFDRVHCSWLLEHVKRPLEILHELRRVLRPDGMCQLVEVDNSTLRTEPAVPEIIEAWDAFNRAQIALGGDPFVGRRLGALLGEAGFTKVEVGALPLDGSRRDPAFFEELVEEFAAIFESAEEIVGTGIAARRLRELLRDPASSMHYGSVIGRACG